MKQHCPKASFFPKGKGAHEARALWAKQREVSPMKQGVPQASLRASEAAKRLELRGHGAKRSPQGRNTAQALAQGGAKVWDDHAELRGAGARNTPRRKIPFSRAKIVSLQFPRPEIRRILAETGGGGSGGGASSPATRGCEKTKSFFTAPCVLETSYRTKRITFQLRAGMCSVAFSPSMHPPGPGVGTTV